MYPDLQHRLLNPGRILRRTPRRMIALTMVCLFAIALCAGSSGQVSGDSIAGGVAASSSQALERGAAPHKDAPYKPTPRKPTKRPARHSPAPAPTPTSSQSTDSLSSLLPDSIPAGANTGDNTAIVASAFDVTGDSLNILLSDTIPTVTGPVGARMDYDQWYEKKIEFNPAPTRAVWLSALCPGLGQIYNRRFWKLPIIVGGYLGLGYATSWNNTMLRDYTRAYRDIMDTDPSTNSYMDFFPPTTKEDDLDKAWLTNLLKSRKNYFRRNRDLCIIGMVGVYLLAMVDAYVDASLSHFDVTPDISMDVTPAVFRDSGGKLPSFGLLWALTF